jgi:hypothetical protein
MSWIKRNLYFLIGSAVALALIGLAGWFLYTKWQLNGENLAKLGRDYSTLVDLNSKKPHPGNEKINNYDAAIKQTAQLLAFKEKARSQFRRILPIPDLPQGELTDQSFATNFSRTISELQRDATNASIGLPADYYFSFQAQARKLSFAPGSLETLSVQLGEVKALCDILFQAKINTIESIRREKISPDDQASSGTGDYLPDKAITNAQAVISPYELTFRCFSQELGMVMAGFACSPDSLVVRAINVEGLAPGALDLAPNPLASMPSPPAYFAPPPQSPVQDAQKRAQDLYRRYGPGRLFRQNGPPQGPAAPPRPVIAPVPGTAPGSPPGSPPGKTGPVLALDEKQMKVVMLVSIVKLAPKAEVASTPKARPKPAPAGTLKAESKPTAAR